MTHTPLTVNKFKTGLVQYQPNQILNNDAFPVLFNAFTYRNTVKRRLGWQTIGQLAITLTDASLGNSSASPWSFNIYSTLASPITGQPNAQIQIGSVTISIATTPDALVFIDQGDGTLATSPVSSNSGTINYATGDVVLTSSDAGGEAATITFTYYPLLPAMGIFDRNDATLNVQNVFMDTVYTYRYVPTVGFQQFPTGTTWPLADYNLPSSQNYWQDSGNNPIFWITNIQGQAGISIQYTNGLSSAVWYPFSPTVDGTNNMYQAKFLIPFRGRLFAFNTLEGTSIASGVNYRNRIRCCAIGTPFTETSVIVTTVNANAWNDTIPGQGYFQDIPTNEEIVGAWQVMNQIIVKSSRKTYVITYTGISTTPFKVELLDDNQGSTSGFSAANMGSYIIDVGNRSVNETSPVSLKTIDEKILNFCFEINKGNNGFARVYGIRDFISRCNSYIFPYQAEGENPVRYPNRRLIYNYDNNSWAIYQDSLTCLGYFRENLAITWAEADFTWAEANFTWNQNTTNEPLIVAGNQQGFIGVLDSDVEEGPSLAITNINPNGGSDAAIFTSPLNQMADGTVIMISGIVGDMSSLNDTVGAITSIDENTFYIFTYDSITDEFRLPVTISADDSYIGGGVIQVRYNFNMQTKAFNFIDEGQSMHIAYLDTLVNVNPNVNIQLSVYASLDDSEPVNLSPQNPYGQSIFGNMISLSNPTTYELNEINNRALVNQRANMLTLGFSLSNSTMASDNFLTPFVLSSFTLWMRKAGRPLMPLGGG